MDGDTMYRESQLRLWKLGMERESPSVGCDTLAPGGDGQAVTQAKRR